MSAMTPIERVRCALAMSDAGYKFDPGVEDVAELLKQYDLLRSNPIERYIVRGAGVHKLEWAFIYVDEEKGVFSSYTSFGNYTYQWSHIGTATLKEFLSDVEMDYFMGKTRGREWRRFDFDATVRGIKDHIKRVRREGWLGQVEAREAWNDLVSIENRMSADLFFDDVYSSSALWTAYGGDLSDISCERPDPQCAGFWKVIWPEFLKQIAPNPVETPQETAA